MSRNPPNHWRFRKGTHDREIWYCVVECDEYRIADRDLSNFLVFDIGAHIGSFSYLAASRGATVIAVEPEPHNFRILSDNTSRYGSISRLPVAAWRSDMRCDHLPYAPSDNPANTGGGDVLGGVQMVASMAFDDIVRMHNVTNRAVRRMLKLDCEGSEFPILFTSQLLKQFDEIVGEYHELPYHRKEIPGYARVTIDDRNVLAPWRTSRGDVSFGYSMLEVWLAYHGFVVEIHHEAENIGKFFAVRT